MSNSLPETGFGAMTDHASVETDIPKQSTMHPLSIETQQSMGTAAREIPYEHSLHEKLKTIAGISGNVLEWYDFAVFGFFGDIST